MARKNYEEIEIPAVQTPSSALLGITAMLVMFYIGAKYINAGLGTQDLGFALFAFIHSIYAMTGLILAPLLAGQSIIPVQKSSVKSAGRGLVIFVSLVFLQFFIGMLSISGTDRKLYHVFSAITEENFYRAFLINLITFYLQAKVPEKSAKWIAVIISSFLFALGHLSYWGDLSSMFFVFLTGIIVGFFYIQWKDLTACIFGHLLNNIVVTLVFSV